MQRMVKKGWTPILTPDLIRQEIVKGCGFQPRGVSRWRLFMRPFHITSSQMYSVEGHNLILAGTAEIPLAGLYVNQVIPQEQLPIKLVGFGHCFRLEAGSRGTEAKGLFRVVGVWLSSFHSASTNSAKWNCLHSPLQNRVKWSTKRWFRFKQNSSQSLALISSWSSIAMSG